MKKCFVYLDLRDGIRMDGPYLHQMNGPFQDSMNGHRVQRRFKRNEFIDKVQEEVNYQDIINYRSVYLTVYLSFDLLSICLLFYIPVYLCIGISL